MTHYIALIHEEHGAYGILFPDFPGCVSAGESFDDVVRSGAEALAFHVAGLREDGDMMAPPRTLEAIRAAGNDSIDFTDAVVAAVPLLPQADETERVNVTLPKIGGFALRHLRENLHKHTKGRRRKRSGLALAGRFDNVQFRRAGRVVKLRRELMCRCRASTASVSLGAKGSVGSKTRMATLSISPQGGRRSI